MKAPLISIGLCFLIVYAFAQDSLYPSLEEKGWHVTALEEPPDLKDTDVGAITYLVTIHRNGNVKSIKVLSSTFNVRAEKLWRKKVLDAKFICTKEDTPATGKILGTLLITREACNKEVALDF